MYCLGKYFKIIKSDLIITPDFVQIVLLNLARFLALNNSLQTCFHTFQNVIAIVSPLPWQHLFVVSMDTISESPGTITLYVS